jgi:D-glycero-alpha-D-manno-heptose-7-phosphate kinase
MHVVRVPLRISFAGGGSDYPQYFHEHEGFVLGTTINIFIYLMGIEHTILADHPYKLTYRKTDDADSYQNLAHPVASPAFELVKWDGPGVHISTMADVPGGTGLGSSSAFTVGMLHLLSSMQGKSWLPQQLASNAVKIEREILAEQGGYQDQYHAAFGGLSGYEFKKSQINVSRILNPVAIETISKSMVIVPIGNTRRSHDFAVSTANATKDKSIQFAENARIAKNLHRDLSLAETSDEVLDMLSKTINESWKIKLQYSNEISNMEIDSLIQEGKTKGALAAKLCGAGGGGFILFIIKPENRTSFVSHFEKQNARVVNISNFGSTVINLNDARWDKN